MTQQVIPDQSFPPGRNAPCYCGSQERFRRCCGSQELGRNPPQGVSVVENFLNPDECQALITLADEHHGHRFTHTDSEGNAELDSHRVTEWVDFRQTGQQTLDDLVARAFREVIVPRQGNSIDWYEEPQLLRYEEGGYYLHHTDAYMLETGLNAWKKVVDRDISVLIYLNDGFEGGGLEFKRLFYTLQPKPGMLVWFPSDVRYEHMAKPVTSGRRYVLVSWASSSGVDKIQTRRANRSISWPSGEKYVWD